METLEWESRLLPNTRKRKSSFWIQRKIHQYKTYVLDKQNLWSLTPIKTKQNKIAVILGDMLIAIVVSLHLTFYLIDCIKCSFFKGELLFLSNEHQLNAPLHTGQPSLGIHMGMWDYNVKTTDRKRQQSNIILGFNSRGTVNSSTTSFLPMPLLSSQPEDKTAGTGINWHKACNSLPELVPIQSTLPLPHTLRLKMGSQCRCRGSPNSWSPHNILHNCLPLPWKSRYEDTFSANTRSSMLGKHNPSKWGYYLQILFFYPKNTYKWKSAFQMQRPLPII